MITAAKLPCIFRGDRLRNSNGRKVFGVWRPCHSERKRQEPIWHCDHYGELCSIRRLLPPYRHTRHCLGCPAIVAGSQRPLIHEEIINGNHIQT